MQECAQRVHACAAHNCCPSHVARDRCFDIYRMLSQIQGLIIMRIHQEETPVEPEESIRAASEPAEDDDDADESPMEPGEGDESEAGFQGDSLQTAQDKILSELAQLKDSE